MSIRVCIPTAGTGSRLGEQTRYLNKSLVSVAYRPVLSHLIEQFPADAEFVIALGHKGELVREFLSLAYPERIFFFAEVTPFEGPGSGLGLSLLACKAYLQQPFIFMSCDTLVCEPIPAPTENWMAFSEVEDLSPYRTIKIEAEQVVDICEKGAGKNDTHKAYIGLAGIHDFATFWTAMEQGGATAINTGEAHGLRALLPHINSHRFTWHDTGNPESLAHVREIYKGNHAPVILEKANEAIWFVGGNVIKFSNDTDFIAKRVQRSGGLVGFIPEVTASTPHMYRYEKAEGEILSEIITPALFEHFLTHSKRFWEIAVLDKNEKQQFKNRCLRFYRDKTIERVALFFKTSGRSDSTETINDAPMPTISALLEKIDWDWLADGMPGRFHGDFHFENILWSENTQQFTFLDWRQDFGGHLTIGDMYYDFAKLLHGLIINHDVIAQDLFSVEWNAENIRYDFQRKTPLIECEKDFYAWLEKEKLESKKVRVLTALVYLNIAALHHSPYNQLLFALGKSMLSQEIM